MVMIIQQDLGAPLLVSAGPTDDMMASAADLLPAVSSASSDSSALAGPGRLERWLNKALGPQVGPFVRTEWCLIGGVVTMVVFQIFGKRWLDVEEHVVPKAIGLFIWLFGAILTLAFGVVRHADCLAVRLGEPYGTLILTLSVIGIEAAMMAALMITGEDNPTLARDTMFSVIMIVLTGILGITLLVGGLQNDEQEFNLTGALSYLRVLLPMAVLSLVVPRFTKSDGGSVSPLLGVWLLCMSAGLYGLFLFMQTQSHRRFFEQPASRKQLKAQQAARLAEQQAEGKFGGGDGFAVIRHAAGWRVRPNGGSAARADEGASAAEVAEKTMRSSNSGSVNGMPHARRRDHRGSIVGLELEEHGEGGESMHPGLGSTTYHVAVLFCTMLPVVLLAKSMAKMIQYGIVRTRAPQELGGFLVAILVLSPEAMTAINAARANQLQRTVNIALGSATSTIGMTIPTALAIAYITKQDIELGLENLQITELVLTLLTCMLTFGTGKTNYLQGIVHLTLFLSYIFLIFD